MSAPLAGLLFFVGIVALFAGIFIADTRYDRRVKTGKYPCGECFICTKYWLFSDRYGRVDEIKLRRYIEDYHIEICKYQERELYGEEEME
jgi:hypothetical protein